MRRFELLIPPPLVMLVIGLIMWLLSEMFPAMGLVLFRNIVAPAALGLIGVAISLAGVVAFKGANTTIDPRRPAETSTLVSSGVYRYSRNPMYLGMLLVLIGWGVYLANLLSILCVFAFIAYITRFQIIPEERLLQEKFRTEFLAYKGKVRRWL